MSSPSIYGPSSLLPPALTALSSQITFRLKLIPELHRCLNSSSARHPVVYLWEILARQHALHTLLDLLGAPGSGFIPEETSDQAGDVQERLVTKFIQRVLLLEAQGRLPYGEVCRTDDLLGATANGFMKVLSTVERILNALENTYPGLYELSEDAEARRTNLIEDFVLEEQEYLYALRRMNELVEVLCSNLAPVPSFLTNVAACLARIEAYQTHLLAHAEVFTDSVQDPAWDVLFSLNHTDLYVSGTSSYRSYCLEYPALVDFVDGHLLFPSKSELIQIATSDLYHFIKYPMQHIIYYPQFITSLLSLTHPIKELKCFDSLCKTYLALHTVEKSVLDMGKEVRTAWTIKSMRARSFQWEGPVHSQLGTILLDDQIFVVVADDKLEDHESECSAFLFDKCLLLCSRESPTSSAQPLLSFDYPIEPWDLGPGVRQFHALALYHVIYPAAIRCVEYPGTDSATIDITWQTETGLSRVVLRLPRLPQMSQWIELLKAVAPFAAITPSSMPDNAFIPDMDCDDLESSLASLSTRRTDKALPWSLRARRERTPAPSIFSKRTNGEGTLLKSPTLLAVPRVHHNSSIDYDALSSPGSILSSRDLPSLFERSVTLTNFSYDNGASVPDLTGQIIKTQKYPAAHGGYADVWLADWQRHSGVCKVAVKVLRRKFSEDASAEKMQKRLRRELGVWQRLNHENVLPLYGTCTDFGPYTSLVCPWYHNGSLRGYLQKNDDELKLTQRLKMLCEIAAGLAYCKPQLPMSYRNCYEEFVTVHAFGIVHGDLSGSNILVNDNGQACLCDFGLSAVVEEFMGTSYFTSNLGGAVRWAAPELYQFNLAASHGAADHEELTLQISTLSDIYSFGSVTLEILSGNVPYHYLKSDGQVLIELSKGVRPRRPVSPCITDTEWDFICECWKHPPNLRPSTTDVFKHIRQLYQKSLKRHNTI